MKLFIIIIYNVFFFMSSACFAKPKDMPIDDSIMLKIQRDDDICIQLATMSGFIKIELYQKKTTELVDFFLKYVDSGFYNKLIFHRIIEGFIIQGGAYDEKFNLKEVQLKSPITFPHSEIKNSFGTIALILNKNNSTLVSPQFFINLADNFYLNSAQGNYEYNVIGRIVSGMEVIEKIAHIKIGQRENMYNVPFYPKEAFIQEIKRCHFESKN